MTNQGLWITHYWSYGIEFGSLIHVQLSTDFSTDLTKRELKLKK